MNRKAQTGFVTAFIVLLVFGLLFFGGVGASMQNAIRATNDNSTVSLGLYGFVTNNFIFIISLFYVVAFIAIVALGLGSIQQ